MTINEIWNLVIAAVPAASALVGVAVGACKVVSSIVSLKNSVNKSTTFQNAIIEQLKADNKALRETNIRQDEKIDQLTNLVTKVVDHINTEV